MANEVIIRVTARDDTAGVRDVIRGGFGVTGQQAGQAFSEGVTDGAKQATAKAGDAGKQAGEEFGKGVDAGTKDVPAKASAAGKKAGEEFGKGIGEGAKPAAKKSTEETVDEAAKAAKAKAKAAAADSASSGGILGPLILAGAPLLGATAGAALVGGVGLGLVGLGAVVAAQNDKVRQQVQKFGADLKTEGQAWGNELQQPMVESLGIIRAGFQQLEPEIGQALGNTAPDVKILSQSLVDLGAGAMPGLVTASSRLIPVFEGIDGLTSTVGQATGQMAADVSQHSTTIGTSLSYVGQVIATLEATAAPIIGDLADVFAHTGGTLVSTLHTLGSTIDGVSHTALPALGGGIQADLGVLNAFMGALGPVSSLLGLFGGTALSAYMNVSLLSKLKSPIDSAAKSLEDAGTKGSTFGDVTTKVSKGLSKVGDSLPYIGVGLAVIGTAMDLDSQHANDLTDASDKLAASLEQGGASGVLARNQLDDLRKQAYDATTAIGDLEIQEKQGTQTSGQYGDMAGSNARDIAGLSEKIQDNKQVADDALKKYNDWTAKMGLTAITAAQLSGSVDILATSSQSASSNMSQLKSDVDILNTAASTADQKIKALSDSLAILGDHGLQKAQDYASQFGTALSSFTTQITNAKGAVFNLNGQLDTNSERGRDVLSVLEQSQQSWAGQAQAMADAGVSQAAINQALQGNRDQLAAVLKAAGLTQTQIDGLITTYGLVPKDISTKVHADTQGAMDDTTNLIRWINGQRAVVTVDTVTGNTTALSPGGRSGRNTTASAQGGVTSFPGAASGMALGSGWRIVGEQGAEAIRDAAGATVTPRSGVDKVITDALAQSSGGGGVARLEVSAAGDEVSQLLAFLIKKFVRVYGGGSVQTAFGGNN